MRACQCQHDVGSLARVGVASAFHDASPSPDTRVEPPHDGTRSGQACGDFRSSLAEAKNSHNRPT
jgi:hypothetical protein